MKYYYWGDGKRYNISIKKKINGSYFYCTLHTNDEFDLNIPNTLCTDCNTPQVWSEEEYREWMIQNL